ncbi:MAG: hypothetical protein LH615_10055, partial [Ferruginibacter sp.]|nr:hypothetical protein [Ferruginibacter sp.]
MLGSWRKNNVYRFNYGGGGVFYRVEWSYTFTISILINKISVKDFPLSFSSLTIKTKTPNIEGLPPSIILSPIPAIAGFVSSTILAKTSSKSLSVQLTIIKDGKRCA